MNAAENCDIPACPVCQEDYGDTVIPMILHCGHSICSVCLAALKAQAQGSQTVNCPTCRASSNPTTASKNFILAEAMGIIKQLKENPTPKIPNAITCSECQKIDNEADMFICRDCVNDAFGYDVIGTENPQEDIDIKAVVLCGSCALKNHVMKRHESVPYFPVASRVSLENQLTGIKLLREDLQKQVGNTDNLYSQFGLRIQKFNNEIDEMTVIMRRSKSQNVQNEFLKQIEQEIGKMVHYVTVIHDAIKTQESEYEKTNGALKKLKESGSPSKFPDPFSNTTDSRCSKCSNREKKEKLYCCRTCSQTVSGIMENGLDKFTVENVDLSSLSLCSSCILEHHKSGEHAVEKLLTVEEMKDHILNLIDSVSREMELRQKFLGLHETFKHYIVLLEDYDTRIKRMSAIVDKSVGQPDHINLVKHFQQSLDDAEGALVSMQLTATQDLSRIGQHKLI